MLTCTNMGLCSISSSTRACNKCLETTRNVRCPAKAAGPVLKNLLDNDGERADLSLAELDAKIDEMKEKRELNEKPFTPAEYAKLCGAYESCAAYESPYGEKPGAGAKRLRLELEAKKSETERNKVEENYGSKGGADEELRRLALDMITKPSKPALYPTDHSDAKKKHTPLRKRVEKSEMAKADLDPAESASKDKLGLETKRGEVVDAKIEQSGFLPPLSSAFRTGILSAAALCGQNPRSASWRERLEKVERKHTKAKEHPMPVLTNLLDQKPKSTEREAMGKESPGKRYTLKAQPRLEQQRENATVVENLPVEAKRPIPRAVPSYYLRPPQASEFLKNVYEKDAKSRMVKVVSQGTQTRGVKLATSQATQTAKPISVSQVREAFKPALVSQGFQTISQAHPGTMARGTQTTEIIKPTMMSQGTQTVEVAKPAMVSQGTQTIEQALRATVSRGTQTQYAKPATSQATQTTKPTMVSLGTQTDEIASVEMNPAIKGEKEQDWEDLDLEVPVEDTVEGDDWEVVDV
jgi:hypothetical protein